MQAGVRFVRPLWGYEFPQDLRLPPNVADVDSSASATGLGPIFEYEEARSFYSQLEFALVSRIKAAAEFHHTVPFTTARRPFIFHCEAVVPMLMPFAFQGRAITDRRIPQILRILRDLFADDKCLAIYSHLKTTLREISATFRSTAIDRKLRQLPLVADPLTVKRASPERPLTFLFTNSAHQDPNNLISRGGVLALHIFDLVRRHMPAARLIVAGRDAKATFSKGAGIGPDAKILARHVQMLLERNVDNLVWVEGWQTEASIDRLFHSADFFLLPSIDLHSSSILRAMTNGCIPIVSNAYGVTEILIHARSGIVLNVLDDHVSATTPFGFSNSNHKSYIERFDTILADVQRLISVNLNYIIDPICRSQLQGAMASWVEKRYRSAAVYREFRELLKRAGVRYEAGDLDQLSARLDTAADFQRVGQQTALRLGGVTIVRHGRDVLTVPAAVDPLFATSLEPILADRWHRDIGHFSSVGEALLATFVVTKPGRFREIDLLPVLHHKQFVEVDATWDVELGSGVTLLPPENRGVANDLFQEVRVKKICFVGTEVGSSAFLSLFGRNGATHEVIIAANRVIGETRMGLQSDARHERWAFGLRAEASGWVKLSGVTAIERDRVFMCDFDALPGVLRSKLFTIPATADAGHALYGPYLSLSAGKYRIRWCAFTEDRGHSSDLMLSLELVMGEQVIVSQDVRYHELGVVRDIDFLAEEAQSPAAFEIRLSHYGGRRIVVPFIRLSRIG